MNRNNPITDEQFRLLVEAVKDYAIFILDPTGHVATWNAGAQSIKGYTPDEIIGKHMTVFYLPEDVAAKEPQRLLARATADGRVESEGWRVRKDGTRFWADVIITALRNPAGELVGFAKITRDLTGRRNAEEALRHSEEQLRQMIASVSDYALFMLDAQGRVATWNPGAERLKGYRAEEVLGADLSRFFTPEDIAAGKPALELELAAKLGRFEADAWRVRKDGTRFFANVVISAVRDATGTLVGFTKIARDLTERRKSEQERLRLAQAQEAVRLRDEFLSIASHELRTPLTALHLQLVGVRERTVGVDDKLTQKVDRAVRSSERLADLIEALLDVSRIATGHLALNPEPFDLVDAAREVVERSRDGALNARCELVLRAEAPVIGTWDRLRVEQVIGNLVANAIKYAPGTRIQVAVVREASAAQITVRDGGPGIPEADLSRVFERFERAAAFNHGGMGLGLYIARQIAQAHGGTVTASNVEGGGACFTVRLPLKNG